MATLQLELISKPSAAVREIETQDGAVLLDICQGLCLGMTPIGVVIWRRLKLNQSPDQIASFLADSFRDVSPEQISDDVNRFLEDLRRNRLLISEQEVAQGQQVPKLLRLLGASRLTASRNKETAPRLLFWKALFGLLLYDICGFGKNFGRVHTCVRNWPLARRIADDSVDRVSAAINHACLWYPKRVLCLQRSAVTTCLLRSCGVQARMTLGAQKVPFKAHAWTEVDNVAINERDDVQAIYLVWDRC